MANKLLTSIKKTQQLCEINYEYPVLKKASIPRHLCANIPATKQSITIANLAQKLSENTKEKNAKDPKDQIEIIDLTPEKQENKLYQKRRTRFNENRYNSN